MELALFHSSGTKNFEVAPKLLENVCTLHVKYRSLYF
jgi:hypothetical protein